MHNAALKDEQTGEILQLWAVVSESPRFPNTVTSEPIDVGSSGGRLDARVLGDSIHHEPMVLDVVVDLTGDPGRAMGSVGGRGYEIEQYNKLVDFSNRNTTFTYISYLFINQSALSDEVQPGLNFQFLVMTNFKPIKGGKRPINIIGARLQLQSVVITHGGQPITDPDEAYDYGEQQLRYNEDMAKWSAFSWFTFAGAMIGSAFGPVGTLIGAGIGAVVGAVVPYVGSLFTATGSVPRQIFTTEINGKTFAFELRSNTAHDFVTFSMAYDGTDLVRERRITYGEDLLAGVVDPSVRGLHIVALDPTQQETSVTTENLGRTVQLAAFSEN
jgi:hypothetical protein